MQASQNEIINVLTLFLRTSVGITMAARVSHNEGQKCDRSNYVLNCAKGPNAAGVIGTAAAAGYFLSALGH